MRKIRSKSGFARGFTLMELLVGMFIFALIMIAVGSIFSNSVFSYRVAKNMQQNLENAQYAISYIAKTLRTATLVKYGSIGLVDSTGKVTSVMADWADTNSIVVWDYSGSQCLKFAFDGADPHKLRMSSAAYGSENSLAENLAACAGESFSGGSTPVIGNSVKGMFRVLNTGMTVGATAGGQMGRITILVETCTDPACPDSSQNVSAQSSVSLRDFNILGK